MQTLSLPCEDWEVASNRPSSQVKHFKVDMKREYNTKEVIMKIVEKIRVATTNKMIIEAKETTGNRQQEKTSLRNKHL